jgi:hypothetical protein
MRRIKIEQYTNWSGIQSQIPVNCGYGLILETMDIYFGYNAKHVL